MAVVKAEDLHEDDEQYEGPYIQRVTDREGNKTAALVPVEIWTRLMGEMDALEHTLAELSEQLKPEKSKAKEKVRLEAERELLISAPGILRVMESDGALRAMLVPAAAWEELLEQLDDLEDLVAVYKEELNPSKYVPFQEAMERIEADWAAREIHSTDK